MFLIPMKVWQISIITACEMTPDKLSPHHYTPFNVSHILSKFHSHHLFSGMWWSEQRRLVSEF